ncbi:MAG: ATP-binding cassette domain-containing protein [Firmicutes bacterium]|nr:ATP-binding cassette domain-containing protein [Bacillota bacterium]
MTVIEIDRVTYSYPDSPGPALRDLSARVRAGEFVAVMGASGSGKSTLLRLLNGIVPRMSGGRMEGRVIVLGCDTRTRSVAWLAQKVGMVLQDPDVQLFTDNVFSEVAFGPENLGWNPEEIVESASWALRVVGLEDLRDRAPSGLSGGQKQRLTIAAALATKPSILVLDEPTSQIDSAGSDSIFEVISSLQRQNGLTVVVATNDVERVAECADKVIVLDRGRVAGEGAPADVFSDRKIASAVGRPQTLRLVQALSARGLPLEGSPVRYAECVEALSRLLRGGT